MEYIEIDGLNGAGGGQMLRTALSLSAILGKPFRMINIRAKRPKPGLKAQHLMCVNAAKQICNANVKGAEFDSTELIFEPDEIKGGDFEFLVKTAGSISLIIQTILPILIFAKEESKIKITGGTHAPFAPNLTYLDKVFLPVVKEMGITANVDIKKYGFYPKGGGEVFLCVKPTNTLKSINLTKISEEKQESQKLNAEIILCNLPEHIADRETKIIKNYFPDINIEIKKQNSLSPGNIITIYKTCVGADAIGKIGVTAEKIAEKVCKEFIEQSKYAVDKHLSDQLLLYMALSTGKSEIISSEITDHTKTNIFIIEKFLGNMFKIDNNKITRSYHG